MSNPSKINRSAPIVAITIGMKLPRAGFAAGTRGKAMGGAADGGLTLGIVVPAGGAFGGAGEAGGAVGAGFATGFICAVRCGDGDDLAGGTCDDDAVCIAGGTGGASWHDEQVSPGGIAGCPAGVGGSAAAKDESAKPIAKLINTNRLVIFITQPERRSRASAAAHLTQFTSPVAKNQSP